jgi:aminoglycoside phosphotransferase (APT) family kinase protein
MSDSLAQENAEKIKETIDARQQEDKERLLAALRETPIVLYAVKRAGLGKSSYYRWRHEDKAFAGAAAAAMREGELTINDMSEVQIINQIKAGNLAAAKLWLNTHHPKYANKVEVTHRPRPVSREEFFGELTATEGTRL